MELAGLDTAVVIASRDEDKCATAAVETNKEIRRRCSEYSSETCCGRVVVGPSTSIRDEVQVNNLVSAPCM